MIATAGHVDHGKSALVRALTGMEPDRWAEERRRGMTIDLGYAWTTLPGGHDVAFVDVPGHERFTTNMLAGVGPVPAVLVVVAADGGWSAQTTEHVAAIDALGVRHGLLAVTRSDLADPGPAVADATARLATTSLGRVEAVEVSVVDGTGLAELRAALGRLVAGLPTPDVGARVRLWVDRSFTVTGFGTVVTGTLGAGRISVDDVVSLDDERVSVRRLERMGSPLDAVDAVARVAVNLRGQPRRRPTRGQALLTPGAWLRSDRADVRLTTAGVDRLPQELVLHIGSAAVPVHVRTLDAAHRRLSLRRPLPLQVGDRALLRDPGRHRVVTGVVVIDPAPPELGARGAARARAGVLADASDHPDVADELRRRSVATRRLLTQLGVTPGQTAAGAVEHAGWVVTRPEWDRWGRGLAALVDGAARRDDRLVHDGLGEAEATRALGLPDAALLGPLLSGRPDLALALADGRVVTRGSRRALAEPVVAALRPILAGLSTAPFDAPTADDLAGAGLDARHLGAAAAAGTVLLLPGGVVLLPDAPRQAVLRLGSLPGPFTLSEARQALATSRRVAVPLLEHLDRAGLTRRVDDTRRVLTPRALTPGP